MQTSALFTHRPHFTKTHTKMYKFHFELIATHYINWQTLQSLGSAKLTNLIVEITLSYMRQNNKPKQSFIYLSSLLL